MDGIMMIDPPGDILERGYKTEKTDITFGPVPSRRLGRSLGINHIPPKVCTYSCIYCQVGRTTRLLVEPTAFYESARVRQNVLDRIKVVREGGTSIDYVTFVADGEPTLDSRLQEMIELLKPAGIPVGVISNGALIWREDVRQALAKADWVSLKVDTVDAKVWRMINRPHRDLRLPDVLAGMIEFSTTFNGKLVTETMLVQNVNDKVDHLQRTAHFVGKLCPTVAYISIPTRPPAEKGIRPPDEKALASFYQLLKDKTERVELLTGYEGDAFASTGDTEADILSITAVHPMREDGLRSFLEKAGANWSMVERLIVSHQLVETSYLGNRFFLRRIKQ